MEEVLVKCTLKQLSQGNPPLPKLSLKVQRTLQANGGKVNDAAWCPDPDLHLLVSAHQDGHLAVWDALAQQKLCFTSLKGPSSWVMCCDISTGGDLVCSGGLDNITTIYSLSKSGSPSLRVLRELHGHSSYVCCCRFMSRTHALTSSGDATVGMWDVETGARVHTFKKHSADVLGLAVCSARMFVSGGCDFKAHVWDVRSRCCTNTLTGHDADITDLCKFPGEMAFASASEDSTVLLYDVRMNIPMMRYENALIKESITSVAFSSSGRVLFAGCEDSNCYAFDALKGDMVGVLSGHDDSISTVRTAPDGLALCTASWDSKVKIWA